MRPCHGLFVDALSLGENLFICEGSVDYEDLSREQLINLLIKRDARRKLGLVWERDEIEHDGALNGDFVVMDLDADASCGTAPYRNLVIEADNFDALRWLRMTHAGQVKVIYIDPPYNTGNKDWVYNDDYRSKEDRYRHSTWLEFLFQRLTLARDLLRPDGVIMVSINDENHAKLELLMDEVFPGMRVGSMVWKTRNGSNADQLAYLSVDHEHVLVYANAGFAFSGGEKSYDLYTNPDNDPRGDWQPVSLRLGFSYRERPNLYYPLVDPKTDISYPASPDRVWVYATRARVKPGQKLQNRPMEDLVDEGRVVFPQEQRIEVWDTMDALLDAIDRGDVPRSGSAPMLRRGLPDLDYWVGRRVGFGTPRLKLFKADLRRASKPLSSWIATLGEDGNGDANRIRAGSNTEGAKALKAIFGEKTFNYSKPPSLVRELLRQATDAGDVVLDFFAGSGTTAQVVLELNAEDSLDRRFIMVSSTERTPDEPDKNLCRDICAERIRRVARTADGQGLGGDFAYLVAKRVDFEDLSYDLTADRIWLAVQSTHGLPVAPADRATPVQTAVTDDGLLVAYCDRFTEEAEAALVAAVARHLAIVYAYTPGPIRDLFADSNRVEVRAVTDELLRRFRA